MYCHCVGQHGVVVVLGVPLLTQLSDAPRTSMLDGGEITPVTSSEQLCPG